MSKKARILAASLCAAQLVTLIPVTASAAQTDISVNTISAGKNHSLVIKSDMSLWAAGDNSAGQLGLGEDKESSGGEKVMDKVVYAEANDDVSFAIDINGTLYGWGDNSDGQIDPSSSANYIYKPQKLMTGVTEVSAGESHTVALLEDGKAVGWGSNSFGELGFSSNEKTNAVTNLMSDAADIAAGEDFTLIVSKDGAVYACGSNDNGQLGTGSYRDQESLQKVIASGASMAEAGGDHSIILMADGSVKTAGANDYGQLGSNSDYSTNSSFETVSGLSQIKAVFAGGKDSGALNNSGVLYTWGENTCGQLHNGNTEDLYRPVQAASGAVSIAFGEHHSILLKNNGAVSTVGSGIYGELFSVQNAISAKPEYIDNGIEAFSAGTDHAAMIDSRGNLYTWGNNDKGQLGLGDYTARTKPTLVKLNSSVTGVWCANKATIVQTSDNNTYIFGDNSSNLLGTKTRSSAISKPMINEYLSGTAIDKIAFGENYAIALIGGTVYGWGTNNTGRLGTCERVTYYPEVIDSTLAAVSDIAVGTSHVIALTKSGELMGWGSNGSRQLGVDLDSRYTDAPTLLEIKDRKGNALTFSSIAAAGSHTLAVTNQGDVYAWGDNSDGQLADASSRLRTPTRVSYGVNTVFTAEDYSAAIDTSGGLMLCGSNTSGQLGDGTVKSNSDLMKAILNDVVSVSLGSNFAGCITGSGRLYCWGDNTYGQIGNGRGGVKADPQTVINNGLCQKLIQAEKITLDNTALSLKPKGTARLTATVTPDNAVNKTVTWSSSNTSVATVNETGLVKAVAKGTAVITAATANGLTAQCTVTVAIPVSSFSVSPAKTKTISIDGTFRITSKIYPTNADDKTLLYSSSNEDVAIVDENGTVTAVAPGVAKITVTAKTNPAKTRTITVKVRPEKVKITYRKSTEDGIVLEWDMSEYADGYVVYRRNSAKGNGKVIGEIASDDPDEMTITDENATKGKTYYYYIKSYITIDGKKLYSKSSTVYKIKSKY